MKKESKKMNKKDEKQKKTAGTAFMLALIALIFLSGCTTLDFQSRALECRTGTQGITGAFSRDTMRTTYDQNVAIPFVIDISNRGAYTHEAIIRINHNRDLLNIEPTEKKVVVEGKAPWNECRGTTLKETFTIRPYVLPISVQNFETQISIDACYRYNLELNTQVCVDPGIGSINVLEKNCRLADRHISGGQGGPLGIVRIEPPIYHDNNDVTLRVYLRNYGQGTIIAHMTPDSIDLACSNDENVRNNYAHIKGFLDNYELNCSVFDPEGGPEGKTLLRYEPRTITQNNEEIILRDYYITCKAQNVDITRELLMNVNFNISYFYRDSNVNAQTIRIRKI